MFEGWAADVLASTLGQYLDVQKDKLRISLWSGQGVLENVQLRENALESLQLPVKVLHGRVGKLKLQNLVCLVSSYCIILQNALWMVHGSPLNIELTDIELTACPRSECEWSEEPATARDIALKQAELAAAELAKLGKQKGWGGWYIFEFLVTYIINNLQFSVKNLHIKFVREAALTQGPSEQSDPVSPHAHVGPTGGCQSAPGSHQTVVGLQIDSISTTREARNLSSTVYRLLRRVSQAAQIQREVKVNGFHVYLTTPCQQADNMARKDSTQTVARRVPIPQLLPATSNSPEKRYHSMPEVQLELPTSGVGDGMKLSGSDQDLKQGASHASLYAGQHGTGKQQEITVVDPNYLVNPFDWSIRVAVHKGGDNDGPTTGAGGGVPAALRTNPADTRLELSTNLAPLHLQATPQQLHAVLQLLDDAAIWAKRHRYARFRPAAWARFGTATLSCMQCHDGTDSSRSLASQSSSVCVSKSASSHILQEETTRQRPTSVSPAASRLDLQHSPQQVPECSIADDHQLERNHGDTASKCCTWKDMWRYAGNAVLHDLKQHWKQYGEPPAVAAARQRRLAWMRLRYLVLYKQRLLYVHHKQASDDDSDYPEDDDEGGMYGDSEGYGENDESTYGSDNDQACALSMTASPIRRLRSKSFSQDPSMPDELKPAHTRSRSFDVSGSEGLQMATRQDSKTSPGLDVDTSGKVQEESMSPAARSQRQASTEQSGEQAQSSQVEATDVIAQQNSGKEPCTYGDDDRNRDEVLDEVSRDDVLAGVDVDDGSEMEYSESEPDTNSGSLFVNFVGEELQVMEQALDVKNVIAVREIAERLFQLELHSDSTQGTTWAAWGWSSMARVLGSVTGYGTKGPTKLNKGQLQQMEQLLNNTSQNSSATNGATSGNAVGSIAAAAAAGKMGLPPPADSASSVKVVFSLNMPDVSMHVLTRAAQDLLCLRMHGLYAAVNADPSGLKVSVSLTDIQLLNHSVPSDCDPSLMLCSSAASPSPAPQHPAGVLQACNSEVATPYSRRASADQPQHGHSTQGHLKAQHSSSSLSPLQERRQAFTSTTAAPQDDASLPTQASAVPSSRRQQMGGNNNARSGGSWLRRSTSHSRRAEFAELSWHAGSGDLDAADATSLSPANLLSPAALSSRGSVHRSQTSPPITGTKPQTPVHTQAHAGHGGSTQQDNTTLVGMVLQADISIRMQGNAVFPVPMTTTKASIRVAPLQLSIDMPSVSGIAQHFEGVPLTDSLELRVQRSINALSGPVAQTKAKALLLGLQAPNLMLEAHMASLSIRVSGQPTSSQTLPSAAQLDAVADAAQASLLGILQPSTAPVSTRHASHAPSSNSTTSLAESNKPFIEVQFQGIKISSPGVDTPVTPTRQRLKAFAALQLIPASTVHGSSSSSSVLLDDVCEDAAALAEHVSVVQRSLLLQHYQCQISTVLLLHTNQGTDNTNNTQSRLQDDASGRTRNGYSPDTAGGHCQQGMQPAICVLPERGMHVALSLNKLAFDSSLDQSRIEVSLEGTQDLVLRTSQFTQLQQTLHQIQSSKPADADSTNSSSEVQADARGKSFMECSPSSDNHHDEVQLSPSQTQLALVEEGHLLVRLVVTGPVENHEDEHVSVMLSCATLAHSFNATDKADVTAMMRMSQPIATLPEVLLGSRESAAGCEQQKLQPDSSSSSSGGSVSRYDALRDDPPVDMVGAARDTAAPSLPVLSHSISIGAGLTRLTLIDDEAACTGSSVALHASIPSVSLAFHSLLAQATVCGANITAKVSGNEVQVCTGFGTVRQAVASQAVVQSFLQPWLQIFQSVKATELQVAFNKQVDSVSSQGTPVECSDSHNLHVQQHTRTNKTTTRIGLKGFSVHGYADQASNFIFPSTATNSNSHSDALLDPLVGSCFHDIPYGCLEVVITDTRVVHNPHSTAVADQEDLQQTTDPRSEVAALNQYCPPNPDRQHQEGLDSDEADGVQIRQDEIIDMMHVDVKVGGVSIGLGLVTSIQEALSRINSPEPENELEAPSSSPASSSPNPRTPDVPMHVDVHDNNNERIQDTTQVQKGVVQKRPPQFTVSLQNVSIAAFNDILLGPAAPNSPEHDNQLILFLGVEQFGLKLPLLQPQSAFYKQATDEQHGQEVTNGHLGVAMGEEQLILLKSLFLCVGVKAQSDRLAPVLYVPNATVHAARAAQADGAVGSASGKRIDIHIPSVNLVAIQEQASVLKALLDVMKPASEASSSATGKHVNRKLSSKTGVTSQQATPRRSKSSGVGRHVSEPAARAGVDQHNDLNKPSARHQSPASSVPQRQLSDTAPLVSYGSGLQQPLEVLSGSARGDSAVQKHAAAMHALTVRAKLDSMQLVWSACPFTCPGHASKVQISKIFFDLKSAQRAVDTVSVACENVQQLGQDGSNMGVGPGPSVHASIGWESLFFTLCSTPHVKTSQKSVQNDPIASPGLQAPQESTCRVDVAALHDVVAVIDTKQLSITRTYQRMVHHQSHGLAQHGDLPYPDLSSPWATPTHHASCRQLPDDVYGSDLTFSRFFASPPASHIHPTIGTVISAALPSNGAHRADDAHRPGVAIPGSSDPDTHVRQLFSEGRRGLTGRSQEDADTPSSMSRLSRPHPHVLGQVHASSSADMQSPFQERRSGELPKLPAQGHSPSAAAVLGGSYKAPRSLVSVGSRLNQDFAKGDALYYNFRAPSVGGPLAGMQDVAQIPPGRPADSMVDLDDLDFYSMSEGSHGKGDGNQDLDDELAADLHSEENNDAGKCNNIAGNGRQDSSTSETQMASAKNHVSESLAGTSYIDPAYMSAQEESMPSYATNFFNHRQYNSSIDAAQSLLASPGAILASLPSLAMSISQQETSTSDVVFVSQALTKLYADCHLQPEAVMLQVLGRPNDALPYDQQHNASSTTAEAAEAVGVRLEAVLCWDASMSESSGKPSIQVTLKPLDVTASASSWDEASLGLVEFVKVFSPPQRTHSENQDEMSHAIHVVQGTSMHDADVSPAVNQMPFHELQCRVEDLAFHVVASAAHRSPDLHRSLSMTDVHQSSKADDSMQHADVYLALRVGCSITLGDGLEKGQPACTVIAPAITCSVGHAVLSDDAAQICVHRTDEQHLMHIGGLSVHFVPMAAQHDAHDDLMDVKLEDVSVYAALPVLEIASSVVARFAAEAAAVKDRALTRQSLTGFVEEAASQGTGPITLAQLSHPHQLAFLDASGHETGMSTSDAKDAPQGLLEFTTAGYTHHTRTNDASLQLGHLPQPKSDLRAPLPQPHAEAVQANNVGAHVNESKHEQPLEALFAMLKGAPTGSFKLHVGKLAVVASDVAGSQQLPILEMVVKPLKLSVHHRMHHHAITTHASSRGAPGDHQGTDQATLGRDVARGVAGAAHGMRCEVQIEAGLSCDMFNVDKLGWEPVVDPWPLQVHVSLAADDRVQMQHAQQPSVNALITAPKIMQITFTTTQVSTALRMEAFLRQLQHHHESAANACVPTCVQQQQQQQPAAEPSVSTQQDDSVHSSTSFRMFAQRAQTGAINAAGPHQRTAQRAHTSTQPETVLPRTMLESAATCTGQGASAQTGMWLVNETGVSLSVQMSDRAPAFRSPLLLWAAWDTQQDSTLALPQGCTVALPGTKSRVSNAPDMTQLQGRNTVHSHQVEQRHARLTMQHRMQGNTSTPHTCGQFSLQPETAAFNTSALPGYAVETSAESAACSAASAAVQALQNGCLNSHGQPSIVHNAMAPGMDSDVQKRALHPGDVLHMRLMDDPYYAVWGPVRVHRKLPEREYRSRRCIKPSQIMGTSPRPLSISQPLSPAAVRRAVASAGHPNGARLMHAAATELPPDLHAGSALATMHGFIPGSMMAAPPFTLLCDLSSDPCRSQIMSVHTNVKVYNHLSVHVSMRACDHASTLPAALAGRPALVPHDSAEDLFGFESLFRSQSGAMPMSASVGSTIPARPIRSERLGSDHVDFDDLHDDVSAPTSPVSRLDPAQAKRSASLDPLHNAVMTRYSAALFRRRDAHAARDQVDATPDLQISAGSCVWVPADMLMSSTRTGGLVQISATAGQKCHARSSQNLMQDPEDAWSEVVDLRQVVSELQHQIHMARTNGTGVEASSHYFSRMVKCLLLLSGSDSVAGSANQPAIHILVTAKLSEDERVLEVSLQPPVVLHNQLPVPIQAALQPIHGVARELRQSVMPQASAAILQHDPSWIRSALIRPRGFTWSPPLHMRKPLNMGGMISGFEDRSESAWSSHGGHMSDSDQDDVMSDDSDASSMHRGHRYTVKRRRQGPVLLAKHVFVAKAQSNITAAAPILLRMRIARAADGQITMTVSCPLWVYNCTGMPVAIRSVKSGASSSRQADAAKHDAAHLPDDDRAARDLWVAPCVGETGELLHITAPYTTHTAAAHAAHMATLVAQNTAAQSATGSAPDAAAQHAQHHTAASWSSRSARPSSLLSGPLSPELPKHHHHASARSTISGGGASHSATSKGLGGLSQAFSQQQQTSANLLLSPVSATGGAGAAGFGLQSSHSQPDFLPGGQRVHSPQYTVPSLSGFSAATGAHTGHHYASGHTQHHAHRARVWSSTASHASMVSVVSRSSRSTRVGANLDNNPFWQPEMLPTLCGEILPTQHALQLRIMSQTTPDEVHTADLSSSSSSANKYIRCWSQALNLKDNGSSQIIALPVPVPKEDAASGGVKNMFAGAYFVCVRLVKVKGVKGCYALHVLPRYVLHNTLPVPLQLQQAECGRVRTVLNTNDRWAPLGPAQKRPVHWPDACAPLKLSLRVSEPGWTWSGAVNLGTTSSGHVFAKVRHRNQQETMLVRVDMRTDASGVILATMSHQATAFSPYRVDNFTSNVLHIQQHGCALDDIVRPFSCLPYAWDDLSLPLKVTLKLQGGQLLGSYQLDQVGHCRTVTLKHVPGCAHPKQYTVTVAANGPTRVLQVTDVDSHAVDVMSHKVHAASKPSRDLPACILSARQQALYAVDHLIHMSAHEAGGKLQVAATNRLPSKRVASSTGMVEEDVEQSHDSMSHKSSVSLSECAVSFSLGVAIAGVGLSCVSSTEELAYLEVAGLKLGLVKTDTQAAFFAAVGQLRVDNGLQTSSHPTAVCCPVSYSLVRQPQMQDTSKEWWATADKFLPQSILLSSTSEVAAHPAQALSPTVDNEQATQAQGAVLATTAQKTKEWTAKAKNHRATPPPPGRRCLIVQGNVWLNKPGGVLCMQHVTLQVAPLSVAVEEQHLRALAQFFDDVQKTAQQPSRSQQPARSLLAVNRHACILNVSKARAAAQMVQSEQSRTGDLQRETMPVCEDGAKPTSVSDTQAVAVSTVSGGAPSGADAVPSLSDFRRTNSACVAQIMMHGTSHSSTEHKQAPPTTSQQQLLSRRGAALMLNNINPMTSSVQAVAPLPAMDLSQSVQSITKAAVPKIMHSKFEPQLDLLSLKGHATECVQAVYIEQLYVSRLRMALSFIPIPWSVHKQENLIRSGVATSKGRTLAAITKPDAGRKYLLGRTKSAPGLNRTEPTKSRFDQDDDETCADHTVCAATSTASAASPASPAVVATSSKVIKLLLPLAHLEAAWVSLQPLHLHHSLLDTDGLAQVLARHYMSAAILQVALAIGSLDIFGDVTRLVQAWGVGIWHLLAMPAQGALRGNPVQAVLGVMRGFAGLVQNTSAAAINSSVKYVRKAHAACLAVCPAEVSVALMTAGRNSGVIDSVARGSGADASGVPGVATAGGPLRALSAGYGAILDNVNRELSMLRLGELVKQAPAVVLVPGCVVLRMVDTLLTSVHQAVTRSSAAASTRVRIPRYVDLGRPLQPYCWLDALGRMLQQHVADGMFSSEPFKSCTRLASGVLAIITQSHLLCVQPQHATAATDAVLLFALPMERILQVRAASCQLQVVHFTTATASTGVHHRHRTSGAYGDTATPGSAALLTRSQLPGMNGSTNTGARFKYIIGSQSCGWVHEDSHALVSTQVHQTAKPSARNLGLDDEQHSSAITSQPSADAVSTHRWPGQRRTGITQLSMSGRQSMSGFKQLLSTSSRHGQRPRLSDHSIASSLERQTHRAVTQSTDKAPDNSDMHASNHDMHEADCPKISHDEGVPSHDRHGHEHTAQHTAVTAHAAAPDEVCVLHTVHVRNWVGMLRMLCFSDRDAAQLAEQLQDAVQCSSAEAHGRTLLVGFADS